MARVRLEPWGAGDRALLDALMGDPVMTAHLGGPEDAAKIAARQQRYEGLGGHSPDRMFKIVDEESGDDVGSVGHWDRSWRGEAVYEVGWMVLPAFQGRGIAGSATATVIELARKDGRHRFVHAFPSVDNAASNAICRKLGFTLLGEIEIEYPPGHPMRSNDWRLDLSAP